MKLHSPSPIGSVIPPTVIVATVTLGLFILWYVWIAFTMRFPPLASSEPFRLLSLRELVVFSLIDACLAAGFVIDAVRLRGSPPGLRGAQWTGLALSMLVVVLFQSWVIRAYGPITLGQG